MLRFLFVFSPIIFFSSIYTKIWYTFLFQSYILVYFNSHIVNDRTKLFFWWKEKNYMFTLWYFVLYMILKHKRRVYLNNIFIFYTRIFYRMENINLYKHYWRVISKTHQTRRKLKLYIGIMASVICIQSNVYYT